MAIVYGTNYQKMYIDDPKELGAAGLQHTKMRVLSDFATANIADEVYIGEIPEGAIILSVEAIGNAATFTMEDDAGNAIAVGDQLATRTKLVCVPVGVALTGELILVNYVQC